MRNADITPDRLFEQFKGGMIPPLVSTGRGEFGLISERLLEIYRAGFAGVNNVPMGVLLPRGTGDDRWREGELHYSHVGPVPWATFCRVIRSSFPHSEATSGGSICDECDRSHAYRAEKCGTPIAYVCPNGMIDFAAPVRVEKQTVAVLFSGQVRPRKGASWPQGLVQAGIECQEEDCPTDLYELSQQRISSVSERLGIPRDDVLEACMCDESCTSHRLVGPDEVKEILYRLEEATELLSSLASSTYALHKSQLVATLRFQCTQSLTHLSEDLSSLEETQRGMEGILERFACLMGFDFVILGRMIHEHETVGFDIVVGSEKGDVLEGMRHFPIVEAQQAAFSQAFGNDAEAGFVAVNLSTHKHLPFLSDLFAYHRVHGPADPTIGCVRPRESRDTLLVIGKRASHWVEGMSALDRQLAIEFASAIALVSEILVLLKSVRDSRKAMDRFIEDMAHDIRAPIQDIITKAALKASTSQPRWIQASSQPAERRSHANRSCRPTCLDSTAYLPRPANL